MQNLTTDQLLSRVQSLFKIRKLGEIAGKPLTPLGYDRIDKELMVIDHELDQRKPEGEFRDLFCGSEVVGFEPEYYVRLEQAREEFSQVNQYHDYGLYPSTFLGSY